MEIENYNKATELLKKIKEDNEKLTLLQKYNTVRNGFNPSTQDHRIKLFTQSQNDNNNFFLEVMTAEMVKHLVLMEINLLKARITKNKILLSKL